MESKIKDKVEMIRGTCRIYSAKLYDQLNTCARCITGIHRSQVIGMANKSSQDGYLSRSNFKMIFKIICRYTKEYEDKYEQTPTFDRINEAIEEAKLLEKYADELQESVSSAKLSANLEVLERPASGTL